MLVINKWTCASLRIIEETGRMRMTCLKGAVDRTAIET